MTSLMYNDVLYKFYPSIVHGDIVTSLIFKHKLYVYMNTKDLVTYLLTCIDARDV